MWEIDHPIRPLMGSCTPAPQALREKGPTAYQLAIDDQILASMAGPLAEAWYYGLAVNQLYHWSIRTIQRMLAGSFIKA